MEFEELQKIWDSQNNEPLYAINAKALHNRILSKKKQAWHITNFSELLLISVNIGTGSFILGMNFYNGHGNIFMYLMSVWTFSTAFYILISRVRRIEREHKFDRSMLDDLNHAIATATYQVRLSQLMRWNNLPIAIFIALGMWSSEKPFWIIVLILIFFAFVNYASGWEHRIYKNRKRELEVLQKKTSERRAT